MNITYDPLKQSPDGETDTNKQTYKNIQKQTESKIQVTDDFKQ